MSRLPGRWGMRGLLPVLAFAATGCVATRGDLRVLQQDLVVIRAEALRADSAHRAQLRQVLGAVREVSDSVRLARELLARHQGESNRTLYDLGQQLITVQELMGQSQRRLQELRASLETRTTDLPATPPAGAPAAGPATPAPAAGAAAPGPNQLFQLAQDQLRRGSTSAARTGFSELLTRYPQADVAPDALFYVAESFAAEGDVAAADSTYNQVVVRYPQSAKAPTALYKRARARRLQGDLTEARALFRRIVDRYPRSDEAILAAEELKDLR